MRVRLLLDDVFTSASDRKLVLLNEHPNIEVRLFNPISRRGFKWLNFVFDFRRANRRMHNKSFSVDNAASVVGGRNLGEEYFGLKEKGVFVDFDVIAIGPIVSEISESFDVFWNHSRTLPIDYVAKPRRKETLETYRDTVGQDLRVLYDDVYARVLQEDLLQEVFTDRRTVFPAPMELVTDSPDSLQETAGFERQNLTRDLGERILNAERELIFVSPYYVPLAEGVDFISDIMSQGVDVVMITNSLASTNHVAVHAGYAKFRRPVIRAGMQLYETRADAVPSGTDSEDGPERMTLHTKLIVIDRRYLVVGSPNMDPRSLAINAEKALIIDSEALAGLVVEAIYDALPETTYRVLENESGRLEWHGRINGRKVVEKREPQTSRWRRFKAWFLKIVPDRQL